MPACELLSTCSFLNEKMASKPATAALFKIRFCNADYSKCACYKVFKALGRSKVPPDLFPNQTERADKIINSG
jgi:hypothetical protein